MYKEKLLDNPKIINKLYEYIIENAKFFKTESGYYLTTNELKSEKLRQQYGIEYFRLYEHLLTKTAVLYIKFINNEHLKISVKYFSNKVLQNSKGKKKKRKRKGKKNAKK